MAVLKQVLEASQKKLRNDFKTHSFEICLVVTSAHESFSLFSCLVLSLRNGSQQNSCPSSPTPTKSVWLASNLLIYSVENQS